MKKENIQLRALTQTDLQKTLVWHNQEEIRDTYLGHPFPVNHEKEEAWYRKVLDSNIPLSVFGIEIISTNKLIGLVVLKGINLINREAEMGLFIGDAEEKGKGFAKDASKLALNFGFHELGLNRIFLKVEMQNINAIELYKKLGFMHEGILRKAVFKKNVYRDVAVMSILKEEYGKV